MNEDRQRVSELLGREPRGDYEIVVRDDAGDPVVLKNAPLLDDGTPMPTRYWLIGSEEVRLVGQIEADGGVDEAERDLGLDLIGEAHDRYAAERDAAVPAGHLGPVPSGGVGGTRTGVKCLHAHYAWHLAGGDDPVGRWVEARLDERAQRQRLDTEHTITIDLGTHATTVGIAGTENVIPFGVENLSDDWLRERDPPGPAALTNALGTIADYADDITHEHPQIARTNDVHVRGAVAATLARVEIGAFDIPPETIVSREALEELFRTVATESSADRATNPGLASEHVDLIIAGCCIVLALMRRMQLDHVVIRIDPVAPDDVAVRPAADHISDSRTA